MPEIDKGPTAVAAARVRSGFDAGLRPLTRTVDTRAAVAARGEQAS